MMGYISAPRDASQYREPRRIAKRGYTPKANKYAGTCNCGQHVKAGEGAIYRVNGKWHVACQQHKAVALY